MRFLKSSIFAFSVFLFTCKTSVNLSELDWIIGRWQVNESLAFEEWTKENDDLYRGKGYSIRKKDTLITETIEIVQRDKTIFYIPSVADQNDGNPIEFELISKKRDEFVFENKNHDFPHRIIYHKVSDSIVDARIEGMKQGFFSEIKFRLKKVNSSTNP